MMHQYLADILPNNRPHQQSSPSDNSLSSGTPPHQVSSASPASTALVMSSNSINNHNRQPTSRQLSPNISPSNQGTDSSTRSRNQPSANHHHHQRQHDMSPPSSNLQCPPNPMARQFACHAKSMSAGVVVSVPGISNNLATAAGMNRNNIVSHNPHRALPIDPSFQQHQQQQQQQQHQQQQQQQHMSQQDNANHNQQIIREHQARNQHHRQQSHPPFNHNSQQHQPQRHHPSQSHQFNFDHHPNRSKNNNLNDAHQATSSSIILSNHNLNNIHNRSASAHLSNVILGSQNIHHQQPNQLTNSRNYPSHVTTNSIWSIDENISKSQGKLTSSGYIPHPCLFNPSINDLSCDNVSNASRLMDGSQAPGYYLHASTNLPNSNGSGPIKGPEFLPICDLMFNLISMIIYFCENTFGIIALIALYYHSAYRSWALIGTTFVIASNFICQYLSFKWLYKSKLDECQRKREAQEELEDEEGCERRFYNDLAPNMQNHYCGSCNWLPYNATELQLKFLLVILVEAVLHLFCLGFLVRYIKLVIPITDTSRVKKEARDLCMLRMIHGFVQSIPLILLQSHIICSQPSAASITNLSIISVILSLLNVSWALASFTKYARKKYMHKFVLTWLGIISQLLWRLGTVSSRVVALTIYGVYYGYWVLVILLLHCLTMFFWLIKPGNLLKDELSLTGSKKGLLAMATAWIYCFCYINLEEQNSKLKMTIYYLIMFLENNLLLTVCLIFSSNVNWFKNLAILVVYLGFVVGMMFMLIYYKYLHANLLVNDLSSSQESVDSIADQLTSAGKKIAGFKPGTLRMKNDDTFSSSNRYNRNLSATLQTGSHSEISRTIKPPYLTQNQLSCAQPGLFNCKSNNTKSKKQKSQNSHNHRQSN